MNKKLVPALILVLLHGCVSAPPNLTPQEAEEAEAIEVYRPNETVSQKYIEIQEVTVADCSGQGGGFVRLWGKSGKAIEGLIQKAYVVNADAIVDTQCGSAPLVNNCWVAVRCTGIAVMYEQPDVPSCD